MGVHEVKDVSHTPLDPASYRQHKTPSITTPPPGVFATPGVTAGTLVVTETGNMIVHPLSGNSNANVTRR